MFVISNLILILLSAAVYCFDFQAKTNGLDLCDKQLDHYWVQPEGKFDLEMELELEPEQGTWPKE